MYGVAGDVLIYDGDVMRCCDCGSDDVEVVS